MDWLIITALIGALFLVPTAYAGLIGAPWAPTRIAAVKKAFDDIGIDAKDVVVDLGAGDGAIIIQAASRGARAVGYELSPIMWIVAYIRALGHKRIAIKYGNLYNATLPSSTTLIFFFLMPKHMDQVGKYLASQQISSATLVLSYAFSFKNIAPARIYREKKCAPLYLYELSAIRSQIDIHPH